MKIDWKLLDKKREEEKTTLYIVASGDKGFTAQSSMVMKSNGQDVMVYGSDLFESLIHRVVGKRLSEGFNLEVRCGDNTGVDVLVQDWCRRNGVVPKVHNTNWERGGNGAVYKKNEDLFVWIGLRPHKGCLLLWDGSDRYTRHMIFCAYCQSVPCRVWNYHDKRWLSSEEIYEIQMEVRQEQTKYGRYF